MSKKKEAFQKLKEKGFPIIITIFSNEEFDIETGEYITTSEEVSGFAIFTSVDFSNFVGGSFPTDRQFSLLVFSLLEKNDVPLGSKIKIGEKLFTLNQLEKVMDKLDTVLFKGYVSDEV